MNIASTSLFICFFYIPNRNTTINACLKKQFRFVPYYKNCYIANYKRTLYILHNDHPYQLGINFTSEIIPSNKISSECIIFNTKDEPIIWIKPFFVFNFNSVSE